MISPVSVGEPSRFLLPGFEGRPLAERAETWPAADKGGEIRRRKQEVELLYLLTLKFNSFTLFISMKIS